MVESKLLMSWSEKSLEYPETVAANKMLADAWENGEDTLFSFVLFLLCA
ncbi:hypothetical protein [Candidatus Formimonas warabiya]|nr:hypothetical protein [Candidatus Formimonas warabiya]